MSLRNACFAVFVILLTAGCKVNTEQQEGKALIVCSTSIIRDCVQRIVGDSIEVQSLMGPGIDPHSYNPRPSDIGLLDQATVVVYNGLHLEGKMAELFETLGKRKTVYAVADGIPPSELIHTDLKAGTVDPHCWFDVQTWMKGMANITEQLAKKYPEKAALFRANFKQLQTETENQRVLLRAQLQTIPEAQRVLITSHDAFHYFGRSLGIQVKALQGISTTQEPGVQDVINLVDFIVDHHIKALFVEHSVSPKAIETVVESCAKRGHKVSIGGTLFSDALGDAGGPGGTYVKMLQSNVQTIVKGLKG